MVHSFKDVFFAIILRKISGVINICSATITENSRLNLFIITLRMQLKCAGGWGLTYTYHKIMMQRRIVFRYCCLISMHLTFCFCNVVLTAIILSKVNDTDMQIMRTMFGIPRRPITSFTCPAAAVLKRRLVVKFRTVKTQWALPY